MVKTSDKKTGRYARAGRITKSGARSPDPVDAHVGTRLRMRRSLLGLSQEKLADAVGITFQQIQKYERGTNRVSASRLYQFSRILDVQVSYFFEKFSEQDACIPNYTPLSDNEQEPIMNEGITDSKETADLLRIYYSVTNNETRKDFLKTIKSMAEIIKSGH